jgi:hypothetical protein
VRFFWQSMTEPSASSNAPFLPGEQPPAYEPVGEVAAPVPSSGEQGAAGAAPEAAPSADATIAVEPAAAAPDDLPPADPPAAVGAAADAAPLWHAATEPGLQPEPTVQPQPEVQPEPLTPPAADPVNAAAFAEAPAGAGSEVPAEAPSTPAEPLLEPTPAPTPEPAVAATVHVPAAPDTAEGGGEWDLLVAKLREWIGSGRLQDTLEQYQGPLRAVALAVALVLVLRLYGAVIGAIDSLPLLPGLLELAGVVWLSRFAATRLVRSSDRQELIASLEQRWRAFSGND